MYQFYYNCSKRVEIYFCIKYNKYTYSYLLKFLKIPDKIGNKCGLSVFKNMCRYVLM